MPGLYQALETCSFVILPTAHVSGMAGDWSQRLQQAILGTASRDPMPRRPVWVWFGARDAGESRLQRQGRRRWRSWSQAGEASNAKARNPAMVLQAMGSPTRW